MDAFRFDRFTRALTTAPSRRVVLQGLVATVLGLAPVPPPSTVYARKRKSKLQFNQFGCVNVGDKCRGRDAVCCSGICNGKKPKRGQRDKSRCVAHDESTCRAGQLGVGCGGTDTRCTTSTGFSAICGTTTGNAGFCTHGFVCMACSKDTECREVCGAAAACIQCPNCDGSGTSDTACVGPNPTDCGNPN
ncbi:MAG: hypothetical protein ACRDJC_21160 [Thermomicrobiales bacterium]